LALLLAAFVQEVPSRCGDDEAPGDPEHRYRNAIDSRISAPSSSEHNRTKNEFLATRLARRRRVSGEAPRVKPKKTSADPGGLTTGKIAAKREGGC
jgi:hypothetical protein